MFTGRRKPPGYEMSRLQDFVDDRLTDGGRVVSLTHRQPFKPRTVLVPITVRGWLDHKATVCEAMLGELGLKPATRRFVILCFILQRFQKYNCMSGVRLAVPTGQGARWTTQVASTLPWRDKHYYAEMRLAIPGFVLTTSNLSNVTFSCSSSSYFTSQWAAVTLSGLTQHEQTGRKHTRNVLMHYRR
jgi:hypothetical protein